MKSFPLVKTKWSNEKIMAIAFLAAALYLLPGWTQNPGSILNFLAVLAAGLIIDTAANFIRYKRPVCAVSAAVTVSVLVALSPGVTLWGQLSAAAVALIAGKHIWGGTGRNPVNPAILGLLFLDVVFGVRVPAFAPSLLLLPAVLVSLPFIIIRPFAAAGMIAGMSLSLLWHQSFSLTNALSYGVIFWGCLVITDPVTVTAKPLPGTLLGFLAGFLPLYLGSSAAAMALGVLSANILSFAADAYLGSRGGPRLRLRFKKKERIAYSHDTSFYDMTEESDVRSAVFGSWSKEDILQSIKQNGVFGLGGAAFPTYQKIKAVIDANVTEYHLIVNGVECDPGLIHDKWLLRHNTDQIVQGITLLQQCIPFSTVTIAVKNTGGLRFPEGMAVRRVPDYYPAGAEKLLIREVLKKTLPQDSVPADEGILVLNVQTVTAICEAVCLGKKADTKLITVADLRNMSGCVARVRIGANVHDSVKKVFSDAACIFSGGGMMNASMAADDTVIDQNINFIAAGTFPNYRESPLCSGCGYCSAVCPAGLQVNKIARLVDDNRIDRTTRLHPERCMACGSCSHVCLAGRNLAARVTAAKRSFITTVSDHTDVAIVRGGAAEG